MSTMGILRPLSLPLTCLLLLHFSLPASSFLPSFLPSSLPATALAGRVIEADEDYYLALNVTRAASPEEVRRSYRSLSRVYHPDLFVEQLRFDPEVFSAAELRSFLKEEKVGVAGGVDGVVEKSELVRLAAEAHRRSGRVGTELQRRRDEVNARFALMTVAYDTLYDARSRRAYDLTGDWGVPGVKGKTKDAAKGMGDREEAARVRQRATAAQRDPVQQKVYESYMKEKAEKEAAAAESKQQGRARRERENAEKRRERERLERVMKEGGYLTDEERRLAKQLEIKQMWGNIFSSVFGK